jgi:hypothetical protein
LLLRILMSEKHTKEQTKHDSLLTKLKFPRCYRLINAKEHTNNTTNLKIAQLFL